MAEGLLRHLAGDRIEAFSAGVHPTSVNPYAIQAMADIGIDISQQTSKPARVLLRERFDYVITVCDNARQTCPSFPGTYRKLHWDIEDPAFTHGNEADIMSVFINIRDTIRKYIEEFIAAEVTC